MMAFEAKELNFYEIKSGNLHEKHAVGTWEPSQHLLRHREKNQDNLYRDGRSQVLPGAH
jgi:hypothetical protein